MRIPEKPKNSKSNQLNVLFKREQSQACLSYAERIKRLMRMNYSSGSDQAKEKRGYPKNPALSGMLSLLKHLLP
jgi:hypothetical protein